MADTREQLGVPSTPFFYTIDQVAGMMQIDESVVRNSILFYLGRSVGVAPKNKLIATNMMPEGVTPEWRILDKHFYRFLRMKGYRYQAPSFR